MAEARLTYCGNVHAAEDLDGWLRGLTLYGAPIAEGQRRQGRQFGLGAWWNARTAAQLAGDPGSLGRARDCLSRHGLEIWTLNLFPFGGFHTDRVKERVYRPDWADERRLQYTRDAAEAVAALVPAGSRVPLSTLPLGQGTGDLRLMARNLARAASALAAIREETGVELVLSLEPEPFCLLETVAGAAEFLETYLFDEGSWTVPADVLRRHLGLCVDLCHLAVVGEDPLDACRLLRDRGVALGKIQVSSCLEVRAPGGLDRLLEFDEPRYLHQSVAESGARAFDLSEVGERRAEFERAGRIRTHYHMPLFWDEEGDFGSSRADVERVLPGLADPLPLLEVETYTWSVLPGHLGEEDLIAGIGQELDFARSLLPG